MRISYIQRLHSKSQNKKDKVDFICILRLREHASETYHNGQRIGLSSIDMYMPINRDLS